MVLCTDLIPDVTCTDSAVRWVGGSLIDKLDSGLDSKPLYIVIVVLPVNFLSLASVNSLGLAPRCEEEGCDWEAAAAGVGGVTEAGGWARRSHPAPPPPPPPSSVSPPLSSDSRDSRGH